MTAWPLLTMEIAGEADVVAVRRRAKRVAELVGFENQDQTKIATAVSEIARNAYEYAGQAKVVFRLDNGRDKSQIFVIAIEDRGPGIGDMDAILEGRSPSKTGLGIGIVGAKRLVDEFYVETKPGRGTRVEMGKPLPKRADAVTRERLSAIADQLATESERIEPLALLSQHNRELVDALWELRLRQNELSELNQELEDTNRGVVALYGELEQNADQLRRASELKTRFLSHMSHEFRTPLNSILALSDLLIKRVDGELSAEQERQVGFIKRSAEGLYVLVNDLLDIAKLEAGRVDIYPSKFEVAELFSALRGALKPLQKDDAVNLIFEELPESLPTVTSDEGKVAQIVRNFISNALKFTLAGEVRVSATHNRQQDHLVIAVADTGIGIDHEDHVRIFEEFSQIDSPTQRVVKGTGLGLCLSRRLAEILGGEVYFKSEVGKGSTFTLSIPVVLSDRGHSSPLPEQRDQAADNNTTPTAPGREIAILVADDDPAFRYALCQMILSKGLPYRISEAHDGVDCVRKVHETRPDIVVLDLQMPHRDGYQVLQDLSEDPRTSDIPVLILSSADIENVSRDRIGDAAAFLSKRELTPHTIAATIDRILGQRP